MQDLFAPEPAVAVGDDPRHYARLMSAVYDATMAGARAPARPRAVIEDSWRRMMARGLDPERLAEPLVRSSDLESARQSSGLVNVLEDVSRSLESLIADGDNILVIADAQGRVLWRSGSTAVLDHADRLGFIEGAQWGESAVGTNAIGTALASQRSVQVFSAEHYQRSHHPWTCAGAPVKDPRTGEVIGVLDVSGPAATVHPTTVALVDVVARLAESRLREQHEQTLNRLRAVAAPILARVGAPALAVDQDGWVAAVDSLPAQRRVALPTEITAGRLWMPQLGTCDIEVLPGGWLIRPVVGDAAHGASAVTLDIHDPNAPCLEIAGHYGRWRHDLSPRHAEILLILAAHRAGRSAADLAEDLYGDRTRVVTVRAEMSRLRKQLSGVVLGRPYRFAPSATVDIRGPQRDAPKGGMAPID
ncbi:helix-turn-helix domain-containing protein [Demetria terragena]|uniref:helix-turn-helix domain-containing protein n=1 Tax=Demetria terragena TaxID=63959 RepID=UPI00035C8603|nr:helix-turn-helix domain-containing protein [Demetria terragena]